jgi:hypothetical protein
MPDMDFISAIGHGMGSLMECQAGVAGDAVSITAHLLKGSKEATPHQLVYLHDIR